MSRDAKLKVQYRKWRFVFRDADAEGEVDCLIISPYGVPTGAVKGVTRQGAQEEAENVVDQIIEDHYPNAEYGRYTPPTHRRPRPGQPHGVEFGGRMLDESTRKELAYAI